MCSVAKQIGYTDGELRRRGVTCSLQLDFKVPLSRQVAFVWLVVCLMKWSDGVEVE